MLYRLKDNFSCLMRLIRFNDLVFIFATALAGLFSHAAFIAVMLIARSQCSANEMPHAIVQMHGRT